MFGRIKLRLDLLGCFWKGSDVWEDFLEYQDLLFDVIFNVFEHYLAVCKKYFGPRLFVCPVKNILNGKFGRSSTQALKHSNARTLKMNADN